MNVELKGLATGVYLITLAGCASTPATSSPPPPARVEWSWKQVPGGMLRMGSEPGSSGHDRDEEPRLELSIAAFEMLATPITVAHWDTLELKVRELAPEARWWREAQTPTGWLGRCNIGSVKTSHPANCVSHRAARAFCQALGGDLPTEAEREYAMRSGSNTAFPWGDSFDPARAVSSVACGQRGCAGATSVITLTGPRCNALGLCDLIGNVWEWTSTDYQESLGDYVNIPSGSEPVRPVLRGGSWQNEVPETLRVSMRGLNYSSHGLTGVGFRCVRR